MFTPAAGDTLLLAGRTYSFAEHPALPGRGIAYGQQGRRATVYCITDPSGRRLALKVFKPGYRSKRVVAVMSRLGDLEQVPGLEAARWTVIAPDTAPALVQQHPELSYAVLMPWQAGELWVETFLNRCPAAPHQCLRLARAIASTVAGLEVRGLAHADLSGSNMIVDWSAGRVALLGLDNIYMPNLEPPSSLPGGSPGYAHPAGVGGQWNADGDRFSAAVVLAECLGWHSETARQASAAEQFFEPTEVGRSSERLEILCAALAAICPPVVDLFQQAWFSQDLQACPPLRAWAEVLDAAVV